MRKFNFQVKPYRAECLQWSGGNLGDILQMLANAGRIASATLHREKYVMVRHTGGVRTLEIGDWVIKGEDGEVRFYSADEFAVKYEALA